MRIKIATEYSNMFLEQERPQPLSDNRIENIINEFKRQPPIVNISNIIYDDFKVETEKWILSSKLNDLKGFEFFKRKDICIGCTHFIDSLYMQHPIQTIKNDYRYHERLGLSMIRNPGDLINEVPLLISMPFPQIGDKHIHMDSILEECLEKNIPVHIDGSWITCSKNIRFDFSHPAIHSFAISLSKGLGLGWNRIGIRWSREFKKDAISIMNDFNMNCRALVIIGLHFLNKLPSDYLWTAHENSYNKICKDFSLSPTNSIHIALRDGAPVGVSPLIRFLEKQ